MTHEVFALLLALLIGLSLGTAIAASILQTQLDAKDKEVEGLKARLRPFDHDGDGAPGGSRKRA